MTNTDTLDEFEVRINKLGLEAVEAKGTVDFTFAMNRLNTYFHNRFYQWAVRKVYTELKKSKKGEISGTESEWVSDLCMPLFEKRDSNEYNYVRILKNKVENFEYGKSDSQLPFFAMIYPDIYGYPIKHVYTARRKESEWQDMLNVMSSGKERIAKKYRDFVQANEIPDSIESMERFSEIIGIKLEKMMMILADGKRQNVIGLFDSIKNEGGEEEKTVDSTVGRIDEDIEGILNDRHNPNEITGLLLVLNDVYRTHFNEKHRAAYPPFVTKKIIDLRVSDFGRVNQNYADTVNEFWEDIDLPDIREEYSTGEYLCIADWVFDLFEEKRGQILNKEIAAQLNLSESNFTKTINAANSVVKKYYEERTKIY